MKVNAHSVQKTLKEGIVILIQVSQHVRILTLIFQICIFSLY